MGSHGEEIPAKDEENEVTVLVTGFGPFRKEHPLNPAWEITKSLPPFLPPSKMKDSEISLLAEHPPVRILIHPEPIKVAYNTVRPLVPELWESRGKKIDYMVHIGMATGRKYYSVERRGHRDGYMMKDVDDELLGDLERREKEGEEWIWDGLPDEILSDTNIDDIWKRWRVTLPGLDIRVSEDAGRYLCDFIYYSSLAYLTKKEEDRRVVFLHVPVKADETSIQTGVDVTVELIRAIVKSGRLDKILQKECGVEIKNIDVEEHRD